MLMFNLLFRRVLLHVFCQDGDGWHSALCLLLLFVLDSCSTICCAQLAIVIPAVAKYQHVRCKQRCSPINSRTTRIAISLPQAAIIYSPLHSSPPGVLQTIYFYPLYSVFVMHTAVFME
jgi:hypothetical protein